MMIQLLLTMLLIFAAPPLFADDLESEVNKAMVKAEELKVASKTWEGRNSGEPYVTLLNEYETAVNPDYSFEETYHTRVRIQQASAKELGQWPIYYNKAREEITDIQAFVETPQGKKVPAAKIEDEDAYEAAAAYADLKVKVVRMPNADVGSVLDVTVKSKTRSTQIPGQFWDQVIYPAVPAKYFRHTYIFPSTMLLGFKSTRDMYKPLITRNPGTVQYSFTFEETGGLIEEEFMPPAESINGSIYASTIKDWNAIADWYRALMQKNTVDNTEITAQTQTLIKDKTSQKEKARAVVEFIQDNFRYVPLDFGNNYIDPHPTDTVFKNHYADSKDIALLLRQMLKIAGIDSSMALMRNEFTGDPRDALPNPDVFEHALLKVSLDGQSYFLDPLTKGFDFGQYPSAYDNAYVLVIEDAGSHFENFPIAAAEDRALISQSEITVANDGSADFKVHVQLPLEASQAFRSQWTATPEPQRKKFFESLQNNVNQGAEMTSHEVKGMDSRYGPIQLDMEYRTPNAYPVVNDMVLLKEIQQGNIPEFAAKDRHNPIFIPGNSLIKNSNTYHIPDGYKIDFMPQPYSLISEFMDIIVDYARGENTATVNSTYHLKRSTIPAQTYPNIKKFCDNLMKKNDQYIVLKQNSTLDPQVKERMNKQ